MKLVVLRDLQRAGLANPYGPGGEVRQYGGLNAAALPVPRVDVEEADMKRRYDLIRDPEVVAVTAAMPTRLIEPYDAVEPNAGGESWGVTAVGAANSSYTGSDTAVAVLDTGIDSAHPAFSGVTIVQEDFSGTGNGDRNGHGTHCAGIIFGRDVDRSRIGIARGVQRVLVGKVLTDNGVGSSEMVFQGVRWAVEHGARVVSMSLGFDFPGMVRDSIQQGWPADLATSVALEAYRSNLRLFDALMAMIRAQEPFHTGCVVAAAAGNESRRDVNPDYQIAASLPAAADGVLSTGALGRSPNGYVIAPFSNTFPKLCAPGVDIKSARAGGGLRTWSGTSMACPHVAGVAALWWEAIRDMGLPYTAATVIARMIASCNLNSLDPRIDAMERGHGMVAAP